MREGTAAHPRGRLFRNTLSLTAANALSNVTAFVVAAYLARVLTVHGYGQVAFAQSLFVYFSLLTDLGLQTYGVRELARDDDARDELAGNILALRLALALGTAGLLVASLLIMGGGLSGQRALLAAYGLTLIPLGVSLDWVFRGLRRMQYVALGTLIQSLSYLGLVIWTVHGPADVVRVPLAMLGAACIMVILLGIIYARIYGRLRLAFNSALWKHSLRIALPMGLGAFMVQIYYFMDAAVLGFVHGERVVGLYSAAYKVLLLLIGLRGALINSLFPEIARAHLVSRDLLIRMTHLAERVGITLGLPLAAGGIILADEIVVFAFGDAYIQSALILRILMLNIVVIFVNLVYPQLLNAMDRQKEYLMAVSIGAGTNVLLNILLIPPYVMVGAAVATIASEVVVFGVVYALIDSDLRVPLASLCWRPVLATLAEVGVLLATKGTGLHVLARIAIGAIVYFVVLCVLGGGKRDLWVAGAHQHEGRG